MQIVSWPLGVNRTILSDSSPSISENATAADKAENGVEMTRMTNSGAPDVWNISMLFSHSTDDPFYRKYGRTEYETFMAWFKHNTKNGTRPFYFSKINDFTGKTPAVYKFTQNGTPKPSFTGTWAKVTMTWREWLNEAITVSFGEPLADSINAADGLVELRFSAKPESIPSRGDFRWTYKRTYTDDGERKTAEGELVMERMDYDGNKSCQFYYPLFSEAGKVLEGVYEISCTYSGKTVADSFVIGG